MYQEPPQHLTCWSPGDPLHREAGWSTQAGTLADSIPSGWCIQQAPYPAAVSEQSYSHTVTSSTRRRKYHNSFWFFLDFLHTQDLTGHTSGAGPRQTRLRGLASYVVTAFHLTSVLLSWISWVKLIPPLQWDFLLAQGQWDVCLLTNKFQQRFLIIFSLLSKESLLFKSSHSFLQVTYIYVKCQQLHQYNKPWCQLTLLQLSAASFSCGVCSWLVF